MHHILEYNFSVFSEEIVKEDEVRKNLNRLRFNLPSHCVELILDYYKAFEEARKKEKENSLFSKTYGWCLNNVTNLLLRTSMSLSTPSLTQISP